MTITTGPQTKQEEFVEGLGGVWRVSAPLDQGLKALKQAGIKPPYLISGRDLAYARVQKGSNNPLSQNGNYIRERPVYPGNMPDKILLVRSPLNIQLAKKAVKAHRADSEFYLDTNDKLKALVEKYQEQADLDKDKEPEERKVLIVEKRGSFSIPFDKIPIEDLTRWLFLDQAKPYSDLSNQYADDRKWNEDYRQMPVWFSGTSNRNFTNQFWLNRLEGGSGLNGDHRYLNYNYSARGVLEKTGEASSRPRKSTPVKVKLPYTPKQVDKELKRLERISQRKIRLSDLESEVNKVTEFLKTLKQ